WAGFSNPPTTLAATKPPPTVVMNPRRVNSFPFHSDMMHPPLFRASLLVNFVQPPLQVVFVFLLQFWVAGRSIDLARLVLPLGEFLFCRLVGMIENLLNKLRRDEIDAFTIAHYQVARHDGHLADSHWNVDAREHDISDRRGIDGSKVSRHIDLRDTIQISDAAIYDQSSAIGSLVDIEEEIVADYGAVHFLAKEI